jgi:hypothetical protein
MRWIAAAFLVIFCLAGCESKQHEIKYDPERAERNKHPQPEPSSVPKSGIDAVKEIKEIKKQEDEKLKENQKTLQQIDNAH